MTDTERLSKYIDSNPGATTAEVAQALGLSTEAAYRQCRKNLQGTKAAGITTWRAHPVISIPLESGPRRCGARAETPYVTSNVPVFSVAKCSKPEQAERMARMMRSAWRINAECRQATTGGTEVVVPKRHQRQARALVAAYQEGMKAAS